MKDFIENEDYSAEVCSRWGNTAAYEEFEERKHRMSEERAEGTMRLFAEFGALAPDGPESAAAQKKAAELQDYITANFYTCTDEILLSLGEMYVSDERFRKNIDLAGGEGTAEFVRDAIRFYCLKKHS